MTFPRIEPLEALEMRLAKWREAQVKGPGWMRSAAGAIIEDLTAEIAARRAKARAGNAEDAG